MSLLERAPYLFLLALKTSLNCDMSLPVRLPDESNMAVPSLLVM